MRDCTICKVSPVRGKVWHLWWCPRRKHALLALLLLLCLLPAAACAQSPHVQFAEAWLDSVITVPLATDTVERAWCAQAIVAPEHNVITLTMVVEASYQRSFTNVQEEGFGVQFACPIGSIPIHSHLGNRAHPRGPSQGDKLEFFHMLNQPLLALIAYRDVNGTITLIPYGI